MIRTYRSAMAIAAIATLVTACSDDDHPPPLGEERGERDGCRVGAPCDIVDPACQTRLFEVSTCLWGASDAVEPTIQVLTETETTAYLQELLDAVGGTPDEKVFSATQQALWLLGLQETRRTLDDSLETEVSQVLALYANPTEEIVVVDRGESTTDENANVVLIHEFVHALQDQTYDFGSVSAELRETDPILSYKSIAEGDATFYHSIAQGLFSGLTLTLDDLQGFFDSVTLDIEQEALEEANPIEGATSLFPYFHGGRYLTHVRLDGGETAADEALANIPRLTRNIMAAGAGTSLEPPSSSNEAPFEPLSGYELVAADRMGAWYAFLLAGRADASVRPAVDRVLELEDDRILIYRNEEGAVAVAWMLDWTSNGAAAEFADLAAASDVWSVDIEADRVLILAADSLTARSAWREHMAGVSWSAFAATGRAAVPAWTSVRRRAWLGQPRRAWLHPPRE